MAHATIAREHGIAEDQIGVNGVALLYAATTNTIPSAYWLVVNVWQHPELVKKIREEMQPLVGFSQRDGVRVAALDMSQLNDRHLIVQCCMESIRLANQTVDARHVLRDTIFTDSAGNKHLFRAGANIIWSVKTMHHSKNVWGEDALEFDPSRFGDRKRDRRGQAYAPFGGGTHLCPGREFAYAAILGFATILVLGFNLRLENSSIRVGKARLGEATAKPPADGGRGGVQISRRGGWEDVRWKLTGS